MRLHQKFASVYALSLVCIPLVGLLGSIEGLAVCTIVAGLCYALRDYFAPEPDSINVMTCYAAFAALWFGVGNLCGYVLDPDAYPQYHTYDVPEYLFEAQVLATLGAVVPMVVYDLCKKGIRTNGRRAPSLFGFEVSDRDLIRFSLGLFAIGFVAQFLGIQYGFLGTVGSIISMGPVLLIFIISSRWRSPQATSLPRWTERLAIVVMIYQVGMALLFSNMRNTLIWPVAAYFLPFVLRKQLTPVRVAAGIVLIVCFAVVFQAIGEVRGEVFGTERVSYIIQRPSEAEAGIGGASDALGLVPLTARLSTFNQLTQVVRIAQEEGFQDGETIQYALYIFIPRALWPEKPVIAPGQWFAKKLGRGMDYDETRFSNAINMTIPGELYMNFGWLAVIFGMAGVAFLYHRFWEMSRFFDGDANPVGLVFGYVLFSQAMFNGSHLGGVLNLVFWYISLLGVTWALTFIFQRVRPAQPGERVAGRTEPQSAPL